MKEKIKKILLLIVLIWFIIAFIICTTNIVISLIQLLSKRPIIFSEELLSTLLEEIYLLIITGLIIYGTFALLKGKPFKSILRTACKIFAFVMFAFNSVDTFFSYQIFLNTSSTLKELSIEFNIALQYFIFLTPFIFTIWSLAIGLYLEQKDRKKEEVSLPILLLFFVTLFFSPFISASSKVLILTKPIYDILGPIK